MFKTVWDWSLLLLIVTLVALLAYMVTRTGRVEPTPLTTYREYRLPGYIVREFKLQDGTRCVMSSSGITCAWGERDGKQRINTALIGEPA